MSFPKIVGAEAYRHHVIIYDDVPRIFICARFFKKIWYLLSCFWKNNSRSDLALSFHQIVDKVSSKRHTITSVYGENSEYQSDCIEFVGTMDTLNKLRGFDQIDSHILEGLVEQQTESFWCSVDLLSF